jgi:vacuolar-type H+-ATPase subunit I/STV1
MSEIKEKISELLKNDVVSRHSYFQLKYFLIGKEPTNQAKMWQCLRELKARQEVLDSADLQIEEEKDNLEICNINLQRIDSKEKEIEDELDLRELAIKKRQIKRNTLSISNNIQSLLSKKKDTEEECEFFIQTFKSIEKTEPLKYFDDLDSQKEYWGTKLLEKINLKLLLQNNIDIDLVETALSLPDDVPIKKQVLSKLNYLQSNMLKIKEGFQEKIGKNSGEN